MTTYLSDFLAAIESLPGEVKEKFESMRDMDEVCGLQLVLALGVG